METMLRKATQADLNAIMQMVRQAQAYFKSQGVDQWQDGYPSQSILEADIAHGESYVLECDGTVAAMAVLSFAHEPTYETIYNGAWQTEHEGAVIHRVATGAAHRGRGVALALMQALEALCKQNGIHSIRADTHCKNIPMQRLLCKLGYCECGVILLDDHKSERTAFEKIV